MMSPQSSWSLASTSTVTTLPSAAGAATTSTATSLSTSTGGGGSFSRASSGLEKSEAQRLRSGSTNGVKKCKEKDALCRAMGTLFLQHRVEKLQGDVSRLNCNNRNGNEMAAKENCPWKGGWKGGCSKKKTSDSIGKEVQMKPQSISQTESRKGEIDGQARRLLVVDVSLLIYSLRTIHNWLKEGDCRVVVPMEALRTLDVLKKGDHYLNLAARKATRFLEERFMALSVEDGEGGLVIPGLVPQRESEKVSNAEWQSLEMTLRGGQTTMEQETESSLYDVRQLPHSIRETIACTMYFLRQYTLHPEKKTTATDAAAAPIVSLALALPPPHFDCSEDVAGINPQCIKYGQRADGNLLLQVARYLGLGDTSSSLGDRLVVAPTAASWLTAEATGRDGR